MLPGKKGDPFHGTVPGEIPEEEFPYGPEDFQEEEALPAGPLSIFPSKRHLIPAVSLLVLFYAASAIYSNYPAGDNLWVSGRTVLKGAEYWRLLSALFTHADMVHLLSNALMFIVFGWALNAYYGWKVFPLISLILGALTNLFTVMIYPLEVRLMGASGMVYSMAAVWLVFYVRFDTSHYPPARLFRALGFVMVILLPSTLEPHVSYLAHGIGFFAGFFAALVLMFFVSPRDPS